MNVTVIGLGKIGLPIALKIASKGHNVYGIDNNLQMLEMLKVKKTPFHHEKGLQELINLTVNKKLKLTTEYRNAIPQSDVVLILVPLFYGPNGELNYSNIDQVTRKVAKHIQKNSVVIYETTVPVGTTRNRFEKILVRESKLRVGKDFGIVFSPERVYSGRIIEDLSKYPKIVGASDIKTARKAKKFYESFISFSDRADLGKKNGVWIMKSYEESEFVKLAETTYRDVNIALSNQFAKQSEKIGCNIYKIIEATNSQNYCDIHKPGIYVGGHCIPVYPKMYLQGDNSASIVRVARNLNSDMPKYAIKNITKKIGRLRNKKILILGLTYRHGIREMTNSGASEMLDLLKELKSNVFGHDDLLTKKEIVNYGFKIFDKEIKYDLIIVQTENPKYFSSNFYQKIRYSYLYFGRNYGNIETSDFKNSHLLGVGDE
jgi:nucleotide sugar dehydrogenase